MARVAASHRRRRKTSGRTSRRSTHEEQKKQTNSIRRGASSFQRISTVGSSLNTPEPSILELSTPAYTGLVDERERHSQDSISVPDSSTWEQRGGRSRKYDERAASWRTKSPGTNIRVLRLCSTIEQLSAELNEARSQLHELHRQQEKDRADIQARDKCTISILRSIHRQLEVTANGLQRQLQRRSPTKLISRDK